MNASPQPFGELLKELRMAAGLSQEELAERARLSVETISALERGRRQKPYRHTIGLLAGALQLSQTRRTDLERAAAQPSSPIDALSSPVRSIPELPNNLPTQISSFVGRDRDVAKISDLIANYRLVTLAGTGGIGKTRIALHLAAELLRSGSFEAAWLVDFAPVVDPSLVPNTIATALSAQGSPNRAPLENLIAYLKNKRLLLVVDNCEHLIESISSAVNAILQHCPGVRILATSREALAISGERVYHVPSLSVPSPDELRMLDVDKALMYGAIALFVDRAAAADNRFVLTEQLVPVVSEICRRLDGIALAIELAAARINILSATSLAQKLNHRFLVLTGGSRTALPRHKTMRALIDWSYDLLSANEQQLLRRLSIFSGGFTLDMATALWSEDGANAECDALDLVMSLVDKSLIQAEPTSYDTTRYKLLELTRQYGLEKLRESGEYAAIARAHAVALLRLAERFDTLLELTPDFLYGNVLKPEAENWRAAMEWAMGSDGDLQLGQRLIATRNAGVFGMYSIEGRRWVHAAQQACDDATPPELRARLLLTEVRVAAELGRVQQKDTLAAAERALSFYRGVGDRVGIAEAQYHCARIRIFRHDRDGESEMQSVLALARSCRAQDLVVKALAQLGTARLFENDLVTARDFYSEAIALLGAAGCEKFAAELTSNLGEVEFQLGNAETALTHGREAVDALRRLSAIYPLPLALSNCAAYSIALGHFEEARAYAREATVLAHDSGGYLAVVLALEHLAAIAVLESHDYQRAARLLGFVDAHFIELEYVRQYIEQKEHDKVLPILRLELGTQLEDLLNQGAQWSEDHAVAEALMI